MNPFDYVNSITFTKQDIMDQEESYNPYIVNRALSYFPDTVFYAAEMNANYDLSNRMQYDFLRHAIRKRKRFSKWAKSVKSDDIQLIMDYYKYSHEKARQALRVLSEEELQEIRNYRGGQCTQSKN